MTRENNSGHGRSRLHRLARRRVSSAKPARRSSCSTICRPAFAKRCSTASSSSATRATRACSRSYLATSRHRHGHALRRAHRRAGIGRGSAEVLRQQHVREPHAARARAQAPASGTSCSRRRPPCTAFRASGEASEETPTAPINAYGTSKLMTEWMLRDVAAVNPLRYVALRYFNVAGSDPEGRIGQATPKATLLTKVACEVAVGKRDHNLDLRHRLPDARRHRRSRLHPRRGSRRRAS